MSARFFRSSAVFVSAFCIGVPCAPVAFAAADLAGPPTGAAISLQATPTTASLGHSVGKATDVSGLAKRAKRKAAG